VKQGRVMSQKYDVVVANPPYSGLRRFNSTFKKFVQDYYGDYQGGFEILEGGDTFKNIDEDSENEAFAQEYISMYDTYSQVDLTDNINFEKAHELGKELINNFDKYKGHEVLMATHMDKGNVHNHFVINSVNFENGRKLNTSAKELQQLKDFSNELSKEHGFSVPNRNDTITSISF